MNNREKNVERGRISIDLVEIIRSLCKNWLIILAATVIFTGIGFVMNRGEIAPVYKSSTSVLFQGTPSLINVAPSTLSSKNLAAVSKKLDIPELTAKELRKHVTAVPSDTSKTLIFTATYSDPETAKLIVETFRDVSMERLDELFEEEILDYIDEHENESILKLGRLVDLRIVEVIDEANLPSAPVEVKTNTIVWVMALAGFLLSVLLIIVRYLVSEMAFPVKNPDDVTRYLSKEVITVVPEQKSLKEGFAQVKTEGDRVLLNLKELDRRTQEAMKFLKVDMLGKKNKCKVFGFASAAAGEGNTMVSLQTARMLAEAGNKVLYIESDTHAPYLTGEVGLNEFLTAKAAAADVIHATDTEGLNVILAGNVDNVTADRFDRPVFREFIGECREVYDFVIFDIPPARSYIAGYVLAKLCDEIVFVIRSRSVSSQLARRVIQKFEKMGCTIKGVVLNYADMKFDGYYGKYYWGYEEKEKNVLISKIWKKG